MKVLVGRDAVLSALAPLPEGVEVVQRPDAEVEAVLVDEDLASRVGELLPRLPRLRFVQSLFAGVEWLSPHVPAGVVLCTARGVHDGPVSEWVVAAILAMERRLPTFLARQAERRWVRDGSGHDLAGRTVLVIGFGSIGRATAERLAPFGARVVGVGRSEAGELPRLVPEADVVVLLAPLTEATRGLVDERFLAWMRPGGLLVNAARGELVDTAALLEALRSGRVRAALDVVDPEPLPPDHPLWEAPNLLVTPHVAGAVDRWRERAYRFAGEQLRRWANGGPLLNVVLPAT